MCKYIVILFFALAKIAFSQEKLNNQFFFIEHKSLIKNTKSTHYKLNINKLKLFYKIKQKSNDSIVIIIKNKNIINEIKKENILFSACTNHKGEFIFNDHKNDYIWLLVFINKKYYSMDKSSMFLDYDPNIVNKKHGVAQSVQCTCVEPGTWVEYDNADGCYGNWNFSKIDKNTITIYSLNFYIKKIDK